MAEFVRVIDTADVKPDHGIVAAVNGKTLAIFNVEGTFHAIDNTYIHWGGPLGEGELEGEAVTCSWHSWEYNVRTGISLTTPSASVKTYQVKVDGEDIKVLL